MNPKNRAIVIGTNGYHYLMAYWLHLFKKNWEKEVDKVVFAISTPIYPSVWKQTKNMLNSHPKIQVIETGKNWPQSTMQGVQSVLEYKSIGIFHDDLFVFKEGIIDKFFSIVENEGKCVTPIHDTFSRPELVRELMQHKWGGQLPMVEEETGREGYAFYANFFFGPSELIQKTSMNLDTMLIKKGDTDPIFDWQFLTTDINADTDFRFGLELLQAVAQFFCPKEIDMKGYMRDGENPLKAVKRLRKEKAGLFADIPYLHYQTFSYHLAGLMYDQGQRENVSVGAGYKVPRLIHNLTLAPGVRNDVMIKLGTIETFMEVRTWENIKEWHTYVLKEFKYIQKFMKISDKERATMKKHVSEILLR